jgi:uncharacterized protein (TIGR03067 family)
MSELDGTWTCESVTVNGRKLDDETVKSLKLTLDGEQYKTQRGDQVLFDSSYSVDSKPTPKHIDMLGTGEHQGRIGQGIYELAGDVLTICHTMPGGDRPKEFRAEEGSEAYLMMWRRIKR